MRKLARPSLVKRPRTEGDAANLQMELPVLSGAPAANGREADTAEKEGSVRQGSLKNLDARPLLACEIPPRPGVPRSWRVPAAPGALARSCAIAVTRVLHQDTRRRSFDVETSKSSVSQTQVETWQLPEVSPAT